ATYFFGAPVRDARVKYSVYSSNDWSSRYNLMPRPSYYSYFDDWDDNTYSDYGGDYLSEGFAQTDANGDAIVEFDSKPITPPSNGPYGYDYMDKRYKIQAEVTDVSRMSVISSGSVSVTAGSYALFVEPAEYVQRVGHP